TGLTATGISSSQIRLTWNGVVGAQNYVIAQWNGTTWNYTTIGAAQSTYTVGSLSANSTYYFEVAAKNDAGTGGYTPQYAIGKTLAAVSLPGVPANFTAMAASSSQINLAWSAVAGATGYVIDQWNGSAWQQIATTAAASFPVPNLKAGTTYSFD